MTILGFEIRRARPPRRVLRGPEPISEAEFNTVFRNYGPAHPLFRALGQLIEAAEDDANLRAQQDRADRDKHLGTAFAYRLLREDIAIRHENAAKLEAAERQ